MIPLILTNQIKPISFIQKENLSPYQSHPHHTSVIHRAMPHDTQISQLLKSLHYRKTKLKKMKNAIKKKIIPLTKFIANSLHISVGDPETVSNYKYSTAGIVDHLIYVIGILDYWW